MKTLYVLRHAKSSWDHPGTSDFDRPLNKRGLKAAPDMGSVLAQFPVPPELILTSSALRARETSQRVQEALGSVPLQDNPDLYLAPASELIVQLQKTPEPLNALLLVGHNPGLEQLVEVLCFGQSFGALPLRTAGLVHLELTVERWENLGPGQACLNALIPARLIDRLLHS